MKKILLWLIPVFIFTGLSIYFGIGIINLRESNKKLYSYFSKKELLSTDNSINLSEVLSKKKNLEDEIINISNDKSLNIDEILEKINKIKEDNKEMTNTIDKLSSTLNNLNEKESQLAIQYNSLNKKYNNLVWEEKQRKIRESTVLIENVPRINQYSNYPTGCESVALTILLKYYGIDVTPDNIIDNLKKGKLPYEEEGVLYGGNPNIEFIGSPYSESSYGVFENPIGEVAGIYKSGVNVRSNVSFSEVLNLIKNNRPVVAWTSISLAIPYISKSWIYKPTMEKIDWKANEHAVVLIGYNDNSVIISDPASGTIKYQSRSIFESRYNYFGKRVVYY